MNKEFKKGQIVIMHSSFNSDRYPDYSLIVVSVGKKYIACQNIDENGNTWGRSERFDKETLQMEDWTHYKLYHNSKEIEDENKRIKMVKEFKSKLEYNTYSLEELMLFKEIHETGIDKWKEKYMTEVL